MLGVPNVLFHVLERKMMLEIYCIFVWEMGNLQVTGLLKYPRWVPTRGIRHGNAAYNGLLLGAALPSGHHYQGLYGRRVTLIVHASG